MEKCANSKLIVYNKKKHSENSIERNRSLSLSGNVILTAKCDIRIFHSKLSTFHSKYKKTQFLFNFLIYFILFKFFYSF